MRPSIEQIAAAEEEFTILDPTEMGLASLDMLGAEAQQVDVNPSQGQP